MPWFVPFGPSDPAQKEGGREGGSREEGERKGRNEKGAAGKGAARTKRYFAVGCAEVGHGIRRGRRYRRLYRRIDRCRASDEPVYGKQKIRASNEASGSAVPIMPPDPPRTLESASFSPPALSAFLSFIHQGGDDSRLSLGSAFCFCFWLDSSMRPGGTVCDSDFHE